MHTIFSKFICFVFLISDQDNDSQNQNEITDRRIPFYQMTTAFWRVIMPFHKNDVPRVS